VTILLTCATGKVAATTVDCLINAGDSVRVLVRDQAKAERWFR